MITSYTQSQPTVLCGAGHEFYMTYDLRHVGSLVSFSQDFFHYFYGHFTFSGKQFLDVIQNWAASLEI